MAELKKHIGIILELGKVKITFFVAFSTSIGYLLNSAQLEWRMTLPAFGVFILAMGSSALNHYQERFSDALMDRTKGRPIPSGRITATHAVVVASILVLLGSLIIYLSSNVTAVLLGWLALIWYNVVYTPLKKKYALAVVPGSLIGAIPPVIGWVASGGALLDLKILSLALFFFIWQIPHFWLLLLLYGKDYEKAGFPTLTKIFSNSQLSRITFVWMAALATSCVIIPFVNISAHFITALVIAALGVWLLIESRDILTDYFERIIFRKAFLRINLYVLAVVLVLSLDKLLLHEF
ncbi:MAG: protoheme IX farnesyltransferase [Bacteroidetes bacterium]|nr:protoheme IX farnesyltransferase [Bacteroidota bacterium]